MTRGAWNGCLAALLVLGPALAAALEAAPPRVRTGVSPDGVPTADDRLPGGTQAVRQIAVRALGRYNGSVAVVEADSGRILTLVNERLALSAGFQPCSTVKLAVTLGALEEGVIAGDTLLRISPQLSINLAEALAYSNNEFFERLGSRLGFERVARYAGLLGFGERAGYGLAGEYPGYFPARPPKRGGVERLSSFGEKIKVTPLQLAALMAALANGGTLYYLQLPPTGQEATFEPRVKRYLPLQRWLPELRAGMEAAVLYGTARSSADVEVRVLGKTGTCVEDRARLGWFASYGEVSTGDRLAVVVLLRGGRTMGGKKAAEVAGEIYRELEDLYRRTRQRQRLELVSAGDE